MSQISHWGGFGATFALSRSSQRLSSNGDAVHERVLGQHRYEVADPVVSGEAGEQGDADVHHALGLRDYDRAPPKPGQPMPLARVVPLDAMCLVLARIELPDWQEHIIAGVVV